MKRSKKLPVIPCGVAVIAHGRKFLIAQRNADDTFGSFWEFPGGKRDRGETFEACVVREAEEELGIRIAVEKKFMEIRKTFQQRIIWLNFYLCSHVSGEPRPIECQNVRWADVAELKKFNFPPANEKVIDELLRTYGVSP